MGTMIYLLKNSSGISSGLRFIVFAVFVFFAFCNVRSQTTVDSKSEDKQTDVKQHSQPFTGNHLPSATSLSVPAQQHTGPAMAEPMGLHAPGINDTDYDAKKAEWILNYPDEYNDYLIKSSSVGRDYEFQNGIETTAPASFTSQGIGGHAPEVSDPGYKTKKALWIQDYPDEYRAALHKASGQFPAKANGDPTMTIAPDSENLQNTAVHAPDLNDRDYEAKKEAWVRNYPGEYKACLENAINDNPIIKNSMSREIIQPASKTYGKAAEHAPDPADPDYTAKKTEWIKNYPDEYHTALKNDPAGNPILNADLPAGIGNLKLKSTVKLSPHAPALNDPDYQAKKEEWIKMYPLEYRQTLNPANNPAQDK